MAGYNIELVPKMAIACISMKRKELYTFDTIDMLWRVQGNYFRAIVI